MFVFEGLGFRVKEVRVQALGYFGCGFRTMTSSGR